jgi:hypothetical protein
VSIERAFRPRGAIERAFRPARVSPAVSDLLCGGGINDPKRRMFFAVLA